MRSLKSYLSKNNKRYVIGDQRGLTLIETLVAITLLVIGLVSIYAVAVRSLTVGTAYRNELVAAVLATEAAEIVRSVRDTNWVENKIVNDTDCAAVGSWREGLCNGDWEVDYNTAASSMSLTAYVAGRFLQFDASTGRYSYSAGANTIFTRKVTFANVPPVGPDIIDGKQMHMTIEIRWTGKGGVNCPGSTTARCFIVETLLYNWLAQ